MAPPYKRPRPNFNSNLKNNKYGSSPDNSSDEQQQDERTQIKLFRDLAAESPFLFMRSDTVAIFYRHRYPNQKLLLSAAAAFTQAAGCKMLKQHGIVFYYMPSKLARLKRSPPPDMETRLKYLGFPAKYTFALIHTLYEFVYGPVGEEDLRNGLRELLPSCPDADDKYVFNRALWMERTRWADVVGDGINDDDEEEEEEGVMDLGSGLGSEDPLRRQHHFRSNDDFISLDDDDDDNQGRSDFEEGSLSDRYSRPESRLSQFSRLSSSPGRSRSPKRRRVESPIEILETSPGPPPAFPAFLTNPPLRNSASVRGIVSTLIERRNQIRPGNPRPNGQDLTVSPLRSDRPASKSRLVLASDFFDPAWTNGKPSTNSTYQMRPSTFSPQPLQQHLSKHRGKSAIVQAAVASPPRPPWTARGM